MTDHVEDYLEKAAFLAVRWPIDLIMKISNPVLRVIVCLLTSPITISYCIVAMVIFSVPLLVIVLAIWIIRDIHNGEF